MAWFDAPPGEETAADVAGAPTHTAGTAELTPLDRVRDALRSTTTPELASLLDDAYGRALQVATGAGGDSAGAELAAIAYASDAIVMFAAEGELLSDDLHSCASALALALNRDMQAVRFILLSRAVANPHLLELPPLPAAGIQLRLLLELGLLQGVSLWRRSPAGQPECVLQLGPGEVGRRTRSEARAVFRRRSGLRLVGHAALRSTPVIRFNQVVGAIVAQGAGDERERAPAFLAATAAALGPVLERELLLDRSRARERTLVASAERRLMRLGFDLHDGPIQDVLALAADMTHLQQQLYPFVLESHRDLAFGRFDDLKARLSELDRALREIAHSLESKSIVSRPLSEILHREVDAFAERSGIDARLEVRGDPESLSSSQRVALFRAVQEALANVREHSGATEVEIRLRARRSSIDVRITDNGAGFEVSHALARAAKRGRLGVVGIGERVRMLGGTFDLESQPGGPTTLSLTLPRVQPEEI